MLFVGVTQAGAILHRTAETFCWHHRPIISLRRLLPTASRRDIHSVFLALEITESVMRASGISDGPVCTVCVITSRIVFYPCTDADADHSQSGKELVA